MLKGAAQYGTKAEVKNVNSFRYIRAALEYEIERQIGVIEDGGRVVQESRLWNNAEGRTYSMRSKEQAHDYRYFPEPDLLPVAIDETMLAAARAAMSELPADRAERLQRELALSAESAQLLALRSELGDYFDAALQAHAEAISSEGDGAGGEDGPERDLGALAQTLANWTTGELLARLPEGADPAASRVRPAALAALVALIAEKRVNVGAARQVLDRLVAEGGDPLAIVESEGLAAIGGEDQLGAIVAAALAANADAAERVRGGNAKAIGPIVGAVMRETKGRADGGEVTRLVHEQLGI
jgi:aspartyl-tRNA(Asn)/glutamyl-tRNA(Gln) amidotransferase subunit B